MRRPEANPAQFTDRPDVRAILKQVDLFQFEIFKVCSVFMFISCIWFADSGRKFHIHVCKSREAFLFYFQYIYVQLMHSHDFVAVAVETFGSWSVEGLAFVNELGKRCSAVSGDDREALFLRQRLSVALQRGNAIAFQDCLNAAFIN